MSEDRASQRPVISIGGAPSSGTTLLADLIDSVPGIACDPELGILSIAEAYAWSPDFVERASTTDPFPSLSTYSAPRPFFNAKYSDLVGFQDGDLAAMLGASSSLCDFLDRFRKLRSEVRQREIRVLAEKTPVNVATAARFLEAFPAGYFVHVVRDPRDVTGSLTARGFGLGEAVTAWAQQVAHGARLLDHERVITVSYDDLLARPFEIAADIADRVGIAVNVDVVRTAFEGNDFRASLPRVESWRAASYEGVVLPPQKSRLTDMERGWVERQSVWTADPSIGLHFEGSVSYLARQVGFEARSVQRARFDVDRLRAIFRQFARAGAVYDQQFTVTEPKSVVGFADRLTKSSLSEWRAFLDAARPWIPVVTLEQIAMQAAERWRREQKALRQSEIERSGANS